jgi:non-specific serine/threonine protein kinase/serine/threonine-protein kinase
LDEDKTRHDETELTHIPEPESEMARTIGPYRLRERIGEGGMGEVFLAEQEKPIRRRVALKLLKAGMDTKQVIARFESERQALALMDHVCIAKVFDAGSTPEGRPYFAMEYVKGVSITSYCDRHRLSTRARLELFMQVCEGVQHAHQKGIIHRDIKASNVLVTIQENKPVPKIIDFGVAKATEQRLTERTVYTQLGVLIGTPEYMSPEQAELTGLEIDTRTDVYSLGVLLYELLTGVLPFDPEDLRTAGFDDLRRRIREEDPSRPSTRVTALDEKRTTHVSATHRVGLPALRRQLTGDLDWITMKALEKDRTRRYGSPNELAADIARHLRHEPVEAGPPSTSYRLGKFVRRHKVGVAASSLVLIALLVGLAGTAFGLFKAQRAEGQARQEAATAERAIELLVGLFEVSDPSEARGNAITAREILDKAAERLGGELGEQPVVRAALMSAVGRVYQNLGLNAAAKPLFEGALATRRRHLGDDHPDTLASITDMATHYLYAGKLDQAEPFCREALERTRRVLGDDHPETLNALDNMGSILQERGELAEAEAYYREALEGRRLVLGSDHEETLVSLNNMGLVLQNLGRLDEAETHFRAALEGHRRVLGDDHPETLTTLSNLGFVHQDMGDLEEAERYARAALEGQRRVLGDDHSQTLVSISNLGTLLETQGRLDEAERFSREALEGLRRTLGNDHFSTLIAINNLGFLLKTQGKLEEAGTFFREAMEGFRRELGGEHRQTLNAMANLGDLHTDLGRYDEAEERLAAAAEAAPRALGREQVTTGLIIRKYGRCLTALKRYREAENALLEAHAILTEVVGPEHIQTERVVRNLGELYDAWGRPDQADSWLAKLPAED